MSFTRDEVKNTWRVTPPSRWKKGTYIAIGLTAGMFFGAGIALSISLDDRPNSAVASPAAIAVLFGLPAAGALAGCALAGSGKRTLIYTAP